MCDDSFFPRDPENLSKKSKEELRFIKTGTAKEIMDRLINGEFPLRTMFDVLSGLQMKNVRRKENEDLFDACLRTLTDGFCEPHQNRNSVKTTQRRRLTTPFMKPQKRDDIFRTAFILGLSETDANLLFFYVTDAMIHYREPRELIFAYALRKNMTFEEALALADRLSEQCGLLDYAQQKDPEATPGTVVMREDQLTLDDEAKLTEYLLTHQKDFSEARLTALGYLKDLLRLLSPETDVNNLNIQELTEEYFSRWEGRPGTDKKKESIQKLINRSWPSDRNQVSDMLTGKIPVTRKLLLLLYILTAETHMEKEKIPANFDNRYMQLQLIMEDCGMDPPDPRKLFDYIVLWALALPDGNQSVNDRFDELMTLLFDAEETARQAAAENARAWTEKLLSMLPDGVGSEQTEWESLTEAFLSAWPTPQENDKINDAERRKEIVRKIALCCRPCDAEQLKKIVSGELPATPELLKLLFILTAEIAINDLRAGFSKEKKTDDGSGTENEGREADSRKEGYDRNGEKDWKEDDELLRDILQDKLFFLLDDCDMDPPHPDDDVFDWFIGFALASPSEQERGAELFNTKLQQIRS